MVFSDDRRGYSHAVLPAACSGRSRLVVGISIVVTFVALAWVSSGAAAGVVSPNWSGYAATGSPGSPVSFTSVTGTWRAPTARCRAGSAGASSVVWVGIGGYAAGARDVAQVGTTARCRSAGGPRYHAWFEIAPHRAFPIRQRVSPGDEVHGSVNVLPHGVELVVENRTRKWRWAKTITWALASTSSAEWIVEAPATCDRGSCGRTPLANFGTVTMTDISATGNGLTGTLANPSWTIVPIWLVPDMATVRLRVASTNVRAGAVPSPVTADGSTFSVAWIPRAPS